MLCNAGAEGIPRLPSSRQLGRVAKGAGFNGQPARSWARVPQLSRALMSLWRLLAKRVFSAALFPARVSNDSLAEWSKAWVRTPRLSLALLCACARRAHCVQSEANVEPAIFGSEGRCLSGVSLCCAAASRDSASWMVRRRRPCRSSSSLLAIPSTEGRKQRRSQGAEPLEAPDRRCQVEGEVSCWLRSPPSKRKRRWAALFERRAPRRPLSSAALAPNSSP